MPSEGSLAPRARRLSAVCLLFYSARTALQIGPTLPPEFWRLTGLRVLGLSDNRLEALPPFLLRSLQVRDPPPPRAWRYAFPYTAMCMSTCARMAMRVPVCGRLHARMRRACLSLRRSR